MCVSACVSVYLCVCVRARVPVYVLFLKFKAFFFNILRYHDLAETVLSKVNKLITKRTFARSSYIYILESIFN